MNGTSYSLIRLYIYLIDFLHMNKYFLIAIGIIFLSSCKNKTATSTTSDILYADLDTTVAPGVDFFAYANGGWIKKNPIPNDQAAWGIGNLVIEETLKRLKEIAVKTSAENAKKDTPEQQIGDFWSTAMDSTKIETDGLKFLQPYINKVNAIKDIPSLMNIVTEFKILGSSTLFSSYVSIDDKNSELIIYQFSQGGIGLPEREYYFKNDSSTINIRNAYLKHMAKMLTMSGEDSISSLNVAKNILALETKLATASKRLEDLRDPYANYHKFAVNDLGSLGNNINWKVFLKNTGVNNVDSVLVGQPEFFKSLNSLLVSIPLNDWKNYLKFNLISDFSVALPDKFDAEAFNFNKLLSGAKQRKVRWKRSITQIEKGMGEMLGRLYVKEYFNEKTKKRYEDLTESIREALKDRIGKLEWMNDSTKQKAYAKLATMQKKIGYPDKWKDFSTMQINKESYLLNLMQVNLWWHNYEINKLGKPVDKDEWDMYPQTYNASYNPAKNEILLPAGIFVVPGFKDEDLDDALVYGYVGASTIGHEITHGFDDQGRQYDAKGNLNNWWTSKDETEFNRRADVMVKQFDAFEPISGYHINGKATLGENIADLGGILLGIEAFKKTKQYQEGKLINGLTPMQRYFLGYSLGWLGHQRDETLRNRLLTDVHSPAKYRVNGPFKNVDEFYTAFDIKPGSNMYVPDNLRVKIW
jgi:putative endopeptidase